VRLDGVHIGAADPAKAARAYALLLGIEPIARSGDAFRFQLERGAVEIEPGEPGLRAIRFVPDEQDASSWPADPSAFHGLDVRVGSTETFVAPPARAGAVSAIDHVVVFTTDPARAIASWRDGRGLRLAFDKEFPARHIRLMFFRSGGLTLEFATPLPVPSEPAGPDRLHGVSYRVPDLEARRAALVAGGLDVSEIRPGNKPGTRVATVRSGTEGVPTLLLENLPAA
jgi:catechol 2,3-dioxygenase-like lactoylglutathione lyase family enzyme